ncbi:hypothetical protein [Psychromonas sp.]|uniref:hypothetical protein n=1 Tax=Psychromonas sp. TaxID=1884585 RepID=UPI003A97BF0A
MTESKLIPYRLPFAIFVFFITYMLLTQTFFVQIPLLTSELIHHLYDPFIVAKQTDMVALIYGIFAGIIGHFLFGKRCEIEPQVNKKGLLKGLGVLALIIAAYGYNLVQQSSIV